jgi:CBS domain-containing protein
VGPRPSGASGPSTAPTTSPTCDREIRGLYHADVLTAHADATVAGRPQQEAFGSLALVEEGRLVGIVTERDPVQT